MRPWLLLSSVSMNSTLIILCAEVGNTKNYAVFSWKRFFKDFYSALQAYSEKSIPMGNVMSFDLSVGSEEKKKNK